MQRTHCSQGRRIENCLATPLFNPGCADLPPFIEQHQNHHLAFETAGDRFGGIEKAIRKLLVELFANFLCPCFC